MAKIKQFHDSIFTEKQFHAFVELLKCSFHIEMLDFFELTNKKKKKKKDENITLKVDTIRSFPLDQMCKNNGYLDV